MANKKIKYDFDTILRKVQLGENLSQEEEVFYLMEGFGLAKEEAGR